jgi:mono/diheme cytochrome c family protein
MAEEPEERLMHAATGIMVALGLASLASSASAAEVPSGESVYKRWCVHCHSAGRGNPGTESLQVKYKGTLPAVLLDRTDLTPEFVKLAVRQGVLSMPPFRKTEITDAELAVMATWLASGGGKRP